MELRVIRRDVGCGQLESENILSNGIGDFPRGEPLENGDEIFHTEIAPSGVVCIFYFVTSKG